MREESDFNLRPREAWANWLICVVLRKIHNTDITFMEDENGDGIIVDKLRGLYLKTEHVCALDIPDAPNLPLGEQRIIDAINKKIGRGKEYAKDKILVVFFDGAGKFFRNRIRESIFGKHNFESVFYVGLLDSGKNGYSYSLTEFKDSLGNQSITYKVQINFDFTNWNITKLI